MTLDVVNCLDFNVFKAERLSAIDDEPLTADILDDSVLLDAPDGSAELKCQSCPAMCTITRVGGEAIALMHNSESCIADIDGPEL